MTGALILWLFATHGLLMCQLGQGVAADKEFTSVEAITPAEEMTPAEDFSSAEEMVSSILKAISASESNEEEEQNGVKDPKRRSPPVIDDKIWTDLLASFNHDPKRRSSLPTSMMDESSSDLLADESFDHDPQRGMSLPTSMMDEISSDLLADESYDHDPQRTSSLSTSMMDDKLWADLLADLSAEHDPHRRSSMPTSMIDDRLFGDLSAEESFDYAPHRRSSPPTSMRNKFWADLSADESSDHVSDFLSRADVGAKNSKSRRYHFTEPRIRHPSTRRQQRQPYSFLDESESAWNPETFKEPSIIEKVTAMDYTSQFAIYTAVVMVSLSGLLLLWGFFFPPKDEQTAVEEIAKDDGNTVDLELNSSVSSKTPMIEAQV